MQFTPSLPQSSLDNRCLTFLVFDDLFTDEKPTDSPPALSYSLETGRVWSRHPLSGERSVVPLRDNTRLASWEPMTTDKLCLMAAELGIAGDDNGLPGRVTQAELAAVVVSPAGFVLRWFDDGTHVGVSDVRHLSGSRTSLTSIHADWNEYHAVNGTVRGPGLHGERIGQAGIGDGRSPIPDDTGMIVLDTLADYGAAAASPVGDIGSDVEGGYASEAADFVARHFGVDVGDIDWREATKARLVSHSFSRSAPFDPIAACAALRLASATSRVQQVMPATGLSAALPRDTLDRVRRRLPRTRPGQ